ncbi:hypothetical protein KQX54_010201 [Cotesia glomerata]|uniref:Uncharacterized protein n=1 Tax=Cotesia glomerata TaxID=32391 RepID=A0AAV7J5W2_COTGL|nr:hypothetical protein KQX54_010201 [Cotesia glomerata]
MSVATYLQLVLLSRPSSEKLLSKQQSEALNHSDSSESLDSATCGFLAGGGRSPRSLLILYILGIELEMAKTKNECVRRYKEDKLSETAGSLMEFKTRCLS